MLDVIDYVNEQKLIGHQFELGGIDIDVNYYRYGFLIPRSPLRPFSIFIIFVTHLLWALPKLGGMLFSNVYKSLGKRKLN